MNAFEKIIGYSEIKQELVQIADTMKNREIYRELGVSTPRGLLLYGDPGLGKTLMEKCLIEASGRTAFTCRKTEPNGEFIKVIKDTPSTRRRRMRQLSFSLTTWTSSPTMMTTTGTRRNT